MILARSIQDILDLVRLPLGPFFVHGTPVVRDGPEDGEKGEHDDGFFVDDVELVADCCYGQTRSGREDGDFGGDAGAGKGVEDRFRRVLRVLLWYIGQASVGGGEGGRERWSGADREGWADTGGACRLSALPLITQSIARMSVVPMALLAMRDAIAMVLVVRGEVAVMTIDVPSRSC